MKIPLRKLQLYNIINNLIIDLPSPSNISYIWNFGSILGICLIIQILTGIILSIHYIPNIELAFFRINRIWRNTESAWWIRLIHANGARLFFIFLYIHIGRGIYYKSYNLIHTWIIGVTIFLITIATAFLGYVLPWGQISFWGATVITNLLSAIPYVGNHLVLWIWGGFAVDNATLNRFFIFHFLFPFIILALIIIHLFYLHLSGSNNPLGLNSNLDKIPFHPYFSFKDLLFIIIIIIFIRIFILLFPFLTFDHDNFLPANPLVTPIHIQPEWYFLFAYAILRAIPNKLGGVIALVISIIILYTLPFINNSIQSIQFYPIHKIIFWIFSIIFIILTWLGAKPVEIPYIIIRQIITVFYFIIFFRIPLSNYFWNKYIY